MNLKLLPSLTFALLISTTAFAAEPLAAGQKAPDFPFTLSDGTKTTLLAQSSKGPVVVYFYPKDNTPGCTKEACTYRDTLPEFTKRKVTVVGVSRQGESSHKDFTSTYKLNFPLVPDESGDITKAYGVGMPVIGFSKRVTFVVKDGKITQVFPKVDPQKNPAEVLAAIDKMK